MQNLLRALKTGGVLPPKVSFDKYCLAWFRCLWRLSRVLSVREHGAALVEAGGTLTVAVARPGSGGRFYPDKKEMKLKEFMGYFHTHPYEYGTEGVAFAADDFVAMINSPMKILVVQSGNYLFMLVRTPETPGRVEPAEISEAVFNNKVADYQEEDKEWQEAVLLTNGHFCIKYHLALYEGKIGQSLRRRV